MAFGNHIFIFLRKQDLTICMKCRILFSWKNKNNIINLSSAELAHRVVKVNEALEKSVTCLFLE